MDNEQIKNTVEHFKQEGVAVRVRDIAFTLLSKMFSDSRTAYQCLFPPEGYEEYIADGTREKLEDYMTKEGYIRNMMQNADGGITFEENRKAMEQMIVDTQRYLDEGLMEPDKAMQIIKDIRVKLTDKFNLNTQQSDRTIIVNKKFDFVCPYTQYECYQLDKETAMKKFNLVENKESQTNIA